MKRITIKDLASMLHLSTSTISRALSDHPDISEATKIRVKETANLMNYRTNLQARFFRKKHSGLLALILPEINMFYNPSVIEGVNAAIADTPYSLVMFQTNNNIKQEKEAIEQCIRWAVEGVMISVTVNTNLYSMGHLKELTLANIKCVMYDRIIPETDFTSITIDNQLTAKKGVDILLKQGHLNILGIFANPSLAITQQRIKGYKKAFRDLGLTPNPDHIITVNRAGLLDNILPVLLSNNTFSSIFTMTDELLYFTTNNLRKLNISIPDDLSVVSISDGIFPNHYYPRITYIEDSGKKMGQAVLHELIENINHPSKEKHKNQLPTKIVWSDSVKQFKK
jgi:Transcriptional regulators